MSINIVSWNIQGRPFKGTITHPERVVPFLSELDSDIICLQELIDATNFLSKIKLKHEYNIYVPEANKGKYNSTSFNANVILSKYPILNSYEITFNEISNCPLENATKIEIETPLGNVQVYNCHFGIVGVGPETRMRQLKKIVDDSERSPVPAIICGDMNVTVPPIGLSRQIVSLWHKEPKREMVIKGQYMKNDEREEFSEFAKNLGFKEVFPLHVPTWSPFCSKKLQLFNLKLDWFLIKGLDIAGTSMGEYISDHRPLHVTITN